MSFRFNPFTGKLGPVQNVPREMGIATGEPTGFVDGTQWTVEYDAATRNMTLTPAGTEDLYDMGVLYKYSAPITVQHDAAAATYYYQFDMTGTLVSTNAGFDFTLPQAAIAIYDPTQTPKGYGLRETHGRQMPGDTHYNLHLSIGTFLVSGGSLVAGSYTVYGPGDADNPTLASITPSVAATTVRDEDFNSPLALLADGGPYNVFRKLHTSVKWDWTTGYQQDAPFLHVANVPQYNPSSGGDALVGLTDDDYFCVYLAAVPVTDDATSQTFRYQWFLGQQRYAPTNPTTAARTTARNNALAEDPYAAGALLLDPLPSSEICIVRKLVMHYRTTFTNNDYRLRIEGEQAITRTRTGASSGSFTLPAILDSNVVITSASVGNLDTGVEVTQNLVNERYAAFGYVGAWSTGAAYRSGNVVQRDGKFLLCIAAHTAAANFYTDMIADRWRLLGDGGVIAANVTTDATPLTLRTVALNSDFAYAIDLKVSALSSGATKPSRVWFIKYFAKKDGATATVAKVSEAGYEEAGTTTWVAEAVASGGNMLINVTGAAGTTVTWWVTATYSAF